MIIAVDFDGTLCANAWPNIGAPRKGVIDYVIRRRQNGAKIILWTSRTGELLKDAVEWCADHGITFDAVNENLPEIIEYYGTDPRKITADEYLEDKAVLPESVDKMRRTAMRGRGSNGI